MTTNGKTLPVLARAFSRSRAKRSSSPATSPPRTTCFDIFSPPPGDSDVISHVDRLSSNETKIAPRSVRIAVGASGRSATVCMVASRVGGSNLTLPKCRSLSTSPWDLEMHPTVKPVALVKDAILDCSRRGGIVLDIFGGSGTTLIAAERPGRTARVIEFDPPYLDGIVRRYEALTGRSAKLERTGQEFAAAAEHVLAAR